MKHYRIVADHGFGDKAWLERMIPESEILEKFKKQCPLRYPKTIEEAEDKSWDYYIEEDDPDEEEDWDWMDS